MQIDLAIARFPYKRVEDPDTVDFLMRLHGKTLRDKRINQVFVAKFDDTPITMTRNASVEWAKKMNADFLLMVDSDMAPDLLLGRSQGAKPFFETSLEFALHNRPCVIGSPYCGPPPFNNVYVFKWANKMNNCPVPDYTLDQYTRGEAEKLEGITEVAALPTGLILIDMAAFSNMKPPYFYYEFRDDTESEKASTEDVVFSRNLSLAGVPMFCNWDAWSGHWKPYCVPKPKSPSVDDMRKRFSEQIIDELLAERIRNGSQDDEAKHARLDTDDELSHL